MTFKRDASFDASTSARSVVRDSRISNITITVVSLYSLNSRIKLVLHCAEIVLDFGIGKAKVDQSGRLKKERMVEFDEITGEPVLVGGDDDALVPKNDTDYLLDELSSTSTSLATTSRTSSDPFGMKKDEELSLDTMNSDSDALTAAIDAQLQKVRHSCSRLQENALLLRYTMVN